MGEEQSKKQRTSIEDDEIDLIALLKVVWDNRKIIYYSVGVSVIIGLLIAIISPVKYKVTATLLPSEENRSSSIGGLSALAGMAGVNIGSMVGQQSIDIPAEIYPQVVNSYPFKNELIHKKFNFEEFEYSTSVYNYVLNDTIESIGKKILKYTIRLPWTLKDALINNSDTPLNTNYDVIYLSKDEERVFEYIEDLIQVEVDDGTGLVSLTVEAKEPIVTAQYVQRAVELLQEYIIDYKTKKVRENLNFIQESYLDKKVEYEKLQKQFFNYKDRHRNIISERSDPEFQRLSDEYDLVSIIYQELAKQLEQARIAVKEQTPAFSVIEPSKVPTEKSSPNRKLILIASVFIGFFIGIFVIFGKQFWITLKDNFKN
nr:Wzz/FepE/Etk N-terminal domain-containing protein [uncultured Carboxylicivirga sp.]